MLVSRLNSRFGHRILGVVVSDTTPECKKNADMCGQQRDINEMTNSQLLSLSGRLNAHSKLHFGSVCQSRHVDLFYDSFLNWLK